MADKLAHVVAVVGAGPAGLFATRALAAAGCRVLLLNRDIKPGGLAEYGIFLDKYKMKGGLRRQFHKILSDPRVEAAGQHPDDLLKALAAKPEPTEATRARLRFRFLASPKRVIAEGGRVVGLEVEETRLERKGERINAVGTGEVSRIPCDTVVFAVGDRVDERFGLPYKEGLYVTAPGAEQDPAAAYQVWDPEKGQPLAGTFVVGWARRASDGVVGRAKLDAETGIKHVLAWLQDRQKRPAAQAPRPDRPGRPAPGPPPPGNRSPRSTRGPRRPG